MIMNEKLKGMWEKAVKAFFTALCWNMPVGVEDMSDSLLLLSKPD
jgi:hypothetical protein